MQLRIKLFLDVCVKDVRKMNFERKIIQDFGHSDAKHTTRFYRDIQGTVVVDEAVVVDETSGETWTMT